jgi:hypothetical protein
MRLSFVPEGSGEMVCRALENTGRGMATAAIAGLAWQLRTGIAEGPAIATVDLNHLITISIKLNGRISAVKAW